MSHWCAYTLKFILKNNKYFTCNASLNVYLPNPPESVCMMSTKSASLLSNLKLIDNFGNNGKAGSRPVIRAGLRFLNALPTTPAACAPKLCPTKCSILWFKPLQTSNLNLISTLKIFRIYKHFTCCISTRWTLLSTYRPLACFALPSDTKVQRKVAWTTLV